MTDTPDAAQIWARERVAERCDDKADRAAVLAGIRDGRWGVTVRAEAYRAGQSHTQAALAARVERLEGLLQTVRDYVADTAAGALVYADSGEGLMAMAKEDLARIDAALVQP